MLKEWSRVRQWSWTYLNTNDWPADSLSPATLWHPSPGDGSLFHVFSLCLVQHCWWQSLCFVHVVFPTWSNPAWHKAQPMLLYSMKEQMSSSIKWESWTSALWTACVTEWFLLVSWLWGGEKWVFLPSVLPAYVCSPLMSHLEPDTIALRQNMSGTCSGAAGP